MDTRETPAAKDAEAAAPQENQETCALATQRTFHTQEEMVLAQTILCCLFLLKNGEVTHAPSNFFLTGSVHLK